MSPLNLLFAFSMHFGVIDKDVDSYEFRSLAEWKISTYALHIY